MILECLSHILPVKIIHLLQHFLLVVDDIFKVILDANFLMLLVILKLIQVQSAEFLEAATSVFTLVFA